MERAILLLGSNLGNRLYYLNQALKLISDKKITITKKSSVYESPAFGYKSDCSYYNLAIEIEYSIEDKALLYTCLDIEKELSRTRSLTQRYADRTIDIDVILIGDKVINSKDLIVPHPRMHEREFCLKPVDEIAGQMIIPTLNKSVKEVLSNLKSTNEVNKINVEV